MKHKTPSNAPVVQRQTDRRLQTIQKGLIRAHEIHKDSLATT